MRRTWIFVVGTTLLISTVFTGCDITSSRNYMGTMAGAEIGGVIGEALGWMSTDRHDGPGKAMLGSVVGTVAGAAVGNALTKDRATSKRKSSNTDDDAYIGGYQTGGGYDYTDSHSGKQHQGKAGSHAVYSDLSIGHVTYQDEDGNGRFSRNETVNIIYEVTNHANTSCRAELKIEAVNDAKSFALSPANVVHIGPHETIRYKAKAFCKGKVSKNATTFRLYALSSTHGNVSTELQIRMSK